MKKDKRIGEMLIEAGLIDHFQLSAALAEQRQWGGRLCSVLVKKGFVDEVSIVSVLEAQIGEKCVSLADMETPPDVLQKVKPDIAKKYSVFPLGCDKSGIILAMPDPTDLKVLDELSFILGLRVKPLLAMESHIRDAIALHYDGIVPKPKENSRDHKVRHDIRENPAAETEIIHFPPPLSPQEMPKEAPAEKSEKKELTTKTVLDALISLLVENGTIAKEDLLRKIREKQNA
jgi:type IV pilus assembly protein PilB